jgi:hypothetical protein
MKHTEFVADLEVLLSASPMHATAEICTRIVAIILLQVVQQRMHNTILTYQSERVRGMRHTDEQGSGALGLSLSHVEGSTLGDWLQCIHIQFLHR